MACCSARGYRLVLSTSSLGVDICSRTLAANTAPGLSNSLSGVCCRAGDGRPMWAAREAEPTGDVLARMITNNIAGCDDAIKLAEVCDEWGGSFNYIHAALVKCAKMRRDAQQSSLFQRLMRTWAKVLPDAQARQCSNVMWACARLGVSDAQLWGSTWEAFIKLVEKELSAADSSQGPTGLPQNVANVLWACAKLRKQPGADQMQLLMKVLLQPNVLSTVNQQDFANTVWALARLQQLPGWQGGVSEQDIQQLLGEEQLQSLIASGNNQGMSNMTVALALLATAPQPLISLVAAQHAASQLLAGRLPSLKCWEPQAVTNSMWACGELGLFDGQFMAAAVAAAPHWVPHSTDYDLIQACGACAQLQYRDHDLLQQLLQQGKQLLQLQPSGKAGRVSPLASADRASIAATCSWSVAKLDMQELAGEARVLVTSSGIAKQPRTHPSNLRRLWIFHCWLLQHRLLDGRGLTRLLTEQQLQQGEKEAAVFGDK